jgi:hypothetical protein
LGRITAIQAISSGLLGTSIKVSSPGYVKPMSKREMKRQFLQRSAPNMAEEWYERTLDAMEASSQNEPSPKQTEPAPEEPSGGSFMRTTP